MPVSWIDGDIELNHFINTIIYSRDSQSLDEAYRALSSKEKMKKPRVAVLMLKPKV